MQKPYRRILMNGELMMCRKRPFFQYHFLPGNLFPDRYRPGVNSVKFHKPNTAFNLIYPVLLTGTFAPEVKMASWFSFSYASIRVICCTFIIKERCVRTNKLGSRTCSK